MFDIIFLCVIFSLLPHIFILNFIIIVFCICSFFKIVLFSLLPVLIFFCCFLSHYFVLFF